MKKFIVLFILLLPLSMVAQEIKIAIVSTNDVINAMPEVAALEKEMASMRKVYDNQLKSFTDDYERKYGDFMAKQDSLTENIKMALAQEIEEIRTRTENFHQMALQDMEKKQQELFAPIREKLIKAIEDVGEENGYTCVITPEALLYRSKSVIDATEKVKAKLGIK